MKRFAGKSSGFSSSQVKFQLGCCNPRHDCSTALWKRLIPSAQCQACRGFRPHHELQDFLKPMSLRVLLRNRRGMTHQETLVLFSKACVYHKLGRPPETWGNQTLKTHSKGLVIVSNSWQKCFLLQSLSSLSNMKLFVHSGSEGCFYASLGTVVKLSAAQTQKPALCRAGGEKLKVVLQISERPHSSLSDFADYSEKAFVREKRERGEDSAVCGWDQTQRRCLMPVGR